MGVASAAPPSLTVHNSLPVFASNARKRASSVEPTKTSPPAVGCPADFLIVIFHARELSEFVGIDEQIAQLRIERRPEPVDAAMVAGELHAQAIVTDRKVRSAQLHAYDEFLTCGFEFWGDGGDIFRAHRHPRERWRFERERLGFRCSFERHLAWGYRTFLDTINRLTGDAI